MGLQVKAFIISQWQNFCSASFCFNLGLLFTQIIYAETKLAIPRNRNILTEKAIALVCSEPQIYCCLPAGRCPPYGWIFLCLITLAEMNLVSGLWNACSDYAVPFFIARGKQFRVCRILKFSFFHFSHDHHFWTQGVETIRIFILI